MSNNQKYILCFMVFPLPMLLVILGAQSAYWFGSIAGNWPPAIILYFASIGIGAFSLYRFNFSSHTKRYIFTGTYTVLLAVLLWLGVFLTACSNGDCI